MLKVAGVVECDIPLCMHSKVREFTVETESGKINVANVQWLTK